MATNALGMAIDSRGDALAGSSTVITDRNSPRRPLPAEHGEPSCSHPLGTVGAPYDNAAAESIWARMQVELVNRQRWRTRVELANAIFEDRRLPRPTTPSLRPSLEHPQSLKTTTVTPTRSPHQQVHRTGGTSSPCLGSTWPASGNVHAWARHRLYTAWAYRSTFRTADRCRRRPLEVSS